MDLAGDRLSGLHALTCALLEASDEAAVARVAVGLGREAMGGQMAGAYFVDETAGVLRLCCSHGVPGGADVEEIPLDSD